MSWLDVEGVLAAHVANYHGGSGHAKCDPECPWEFWGSLPDFMRAHRAHVAAVLREQIAAALVEAKRQGRDEELGERLAFGFGRGTLTTYALAKAWDEGYETGFDDAVFEARGLSTDPDADEFPHSNPYRAAQVAPSRVPGGES